MKKYKLTKSHDGHEAGDSIELTPEQKTYYERVGLIKEEKEVTETKEEKTKVKTK